MDKEKVKRVLIFLCAACIVGGSFFWIEHQRGKSESTTESTTQTTKNSTSESKVESTKSSTEKNQTESEETIVEEQNKIRDFSKRLVNYDSVYKRNQSIKQFLTPECIEENTIDVNPHVDVKATGDVLSIANELDDEHTYFVLAEEKVNNSENKLVVTIKYNVQKKKIEQYEINYIRSQQ